MSISEIHANAMPLIIVPAVGASPNQPCLKAVCRCRHDGDADLSWLPSVAASWEVSEHFQVYIAAFDVCENNNSGFV